MQNANIEYVDLPIYRDGLAQALNFTPSDLEANHAGRLGVNQASIQSGAIARAGIVSVVLVLVAVACVAAAVAIGITTLVGLAALVVAGSCAAWIGVNAWYLVPVRRDVSAGMVSSLEGFVRGVERETDIRTGRFTSVPIWSYYWTIDDRDRLSVPGKAYAALTPARHRLYFLPISRRIVAAEPVHDDHE